MREFWDEEGNHPEEDLAKSGYIPNVKQKIFNHPSMLLATSLKLTVEIWWFLFLFGPFLAIETIKIHFIF